MVMFELSCQLILAMLHALQKQYIYIWKEGKSENI